MPAPAEVRQTVLTCLKQFLGSTDRTGRDFNDKTNLITGLGLTSDEGVDFVLELCDAFGFHFPNDFNPFVLDNGKRGRRVGEMISAVASHLSTAGFTK